MKLLLDENLSRRIVPFLQDHFPGSSHVVMGGLERAGDNTVWSDAEENGFVVVSNDSDFHEISLLRVHLRRSFGCVSATERRQWVPRCGRPARAYGFAS